MDWFVLGDVFAISDHITIHKLHKQLNLWPGINKQPRKLLSSDLLQIWRALCKVSQGAWHSPARGMPSVVGIQFQCRIPCHCPCDLLADLDCVILCDTVWYCVMLCDTVWYYDILWYIMWLYVTYCDMLSAACRKSQMDQMGPRIGMNSLGSSRPPASYQRRRGSRGSKMHSAELRPMRKSVRMPVGTFSPPGASMSLGVSIQGRRASRASAGENLPSHRPGTLISDAMWNHEILYMNYPNIHKPTDSKWAVAAKPRLTDD